MNNDLISREALKKAFEDTVCIEPMPYAFVKQIIDNAPTVDAYTIEDVRDLIGLLEKRPQGEWIFMQGVTRGGYYKCNKCGEVERAEKNYCSNCGADMRGKDNG